jgi:hypothetical protein
MDYKQYSLRKLKEQGLSDITDKQLDDWCKSNGKITSGFNVGKLWWSSVSIRSGNGPACSTCISDTKRYKESVLRGENVDKFKFDCSRHCFWWDYFNDKRKCING